jgi:hypothetical protein
VRKVRRIQRRVNLVAILVFLRLRFGWEENSIFGFMVGCDLWEWEYESRYYIEV